MSRVKNPTEFYQQKHTENQALASRYKKLSTINSAVRLALFISAVVSFYFYLKLQISLILIAPITCIAVFLFLVKKSVELQFKKDYHSKLTTLNAQLLASLDYDFSAFSQGNEFAPTHHEYAFDLDFFGEKSLFQFLNRSDNPEAKQALAQLLIHANSNTPKTILKKQQAIQELAENPEFIQQFLAISALHSKPDSNSSPRTIQLWLQQNAGKLSWVESPWLYNGLTAFMLLALAATVFSIITFGTLMWLLAIPALILAPNLGKITAEFNQTSKQLAGLKRYVELLKITKPNAYSSIYLTHKTNLFFGGPKSAFEQLKALDALLDKIDQRNNMLLGIFLNLFLLWDLRFFSQLKTWKNNNVELMQQLFQEINEFEALLSFANYSFNYVGQVCVPTINSNAVIETTAIGHPLIPHKQRVTNNFTITKNQRFVVLTGANMAGKSTFLRTIGLNLVMAQIGAPVLAQSFEFNPVELFSSMRTTDSLKDNESYFYTELKRLKEIMQSAAEKPATFIILDEILKGTNSVDKAIGSKRYIEKLIQYPVYGIIATHDLSLTEISNEHPEIFNQCFEVQFGEHDLIFDYKLYNGVCKNMNASFLLEKMQIV